MNNEKQILKNQFTMLNALLDMPDLGGGNHDSISMRMDETDELLNPKEVVPYEDSLDVCANCGKSLYDHAEHDLCNPLAKVGDKDYSKIFVKSSSEEKNG